MNTAVVCGTDFGESYLAFVFSQNSASTDRFLIVTGQVSVHRLGARFRRPPEFCPLQLGSGQAARDEIARDGATTTVRRALRGFDRDADAGGEGWNVAGGGDAEGQQSANG